MEEELRKMSALQRVEYDFEILYTQQIEMQKLTKQQDVCLIRMHSRYLEKPYSSTSLVFLTVTNPLRKLIINLVLNSKFDSFILTAIMLNCLLLALDDYTSGSWKSTVDTILTFIFLGECVLKVLAMGFVYGKNSYLTDPWNMLDFFVVSTGVLGLVTGGSNVSVLRTVRILRPLRTINSIPEMKVLTVSILNSIPMLVDIFVLILMFILIFALVGAQLYGGNFSVVCFNIDGTNTGNICAYQAGCLEYIVNCGNTGCDTNQYCWDSGKNPYEGTINYDNIAFSFLTIFVAMTMEGWSDTMRYGRGALNQKFLNDIYFYFLIIVGSFFLMQLTVAAIFVKFIESSKEQKNRLKLIEVNKPVVDFTPVKPDAEKESIRMKWYRFRMDFYQRINTDWFSNVTTLAIVLNTFVMGSEYYGITEVHAYINDKLNIALFIFFAIEMIMKIIGLGLKGYVSEPMNIFDGLIVIFGLLEVSLTSVKGLHFLRAFRMLRIFKLARRWKALKIMLLKLINSMKAISYLALLMLIIMFIYTLLGKQLFQHKMDDGTGQNPRSNFDNLFWAFITVFTLLTTQNWNNILAWAVGPTSPIYALYFVSFIIIGSNILLNLFLAILIEQFQNYDPEADEDDDYEAAKAAEEAERQRRRRKKRKNSINEEDEENEDSDVIEAIPLYGVSIYIFSRKNKIRVFFRDMLTHPYFDSSIYTLISFSCLLLAIDEPVKLPYTQRFLGIANYVVLVLFTVEMMMKIIVFGFAFTKNAYLKNSWNLLDIFIIFVSYFDILLSALLGGVVDLSFLRVLRALRALRPLRMVSQNEKMKKVITSVIRTIPELINVMAITLLFYIIFGIIGVIFFEGGMYYCSDPNIIYQDDCQGSYFDLSGNVRNRVWRNKPYHFDHIFNAILSLFFVSVGGGWPDYVYSMVDAVGPGQPSVRDYNQASSLYLVSFIFLVNFFIMNLYLGAIVTNFNAIQKELDGSLFLTNDQKNWVLAQKLMIRCYPRIKFLKPQNKFQGFFYDVIMNYKFDIFIQTCIVLNVIFMCLVNSPIDVALNEFLDTVNFIFTVIFAIEMSLKLTGLGPTLYFADSWNRFDGIVTVISIMTLMPISALGNATVFKSFRIARLFRLVKIYKGFQKVLYTAILAAPALLNIGTLLALLWFVFAVAGMYLFGKFNLETAENLGPMVNFGTFYNSFSLVFQIITQDNFDSIAWEVMSIPDCVGSIYECGSYYFGVPFFVAYIILGINFFLNMFIAVILENFTEEEIDFTLAGLNQKDLRKFEKGWALYSPTGSYYLPIDKLPQLLVNIELPLGFASQGLNSRQVLQIIKALGIKNFDGKIHFADVLWCLASSVAGTSLEEAKTCEAVKSISKAVPMRFPIFSKSDKKQAFYKEDISAAKILAAKIIWKGWTEFKDSGKSRNRAGFLNVIG